MTPDQKMFVLHFVKQLQSCIEKRGVTNSPASVTRQSGQDEQNARCSINRHTGIAPKD